MRYLQRLISPSNGIVFDEIIPVPDAVKTAFKDIFQFDTMNNADFNGLKISKAVQAFIRAAIDKNVCEIAYQPTESSKTIHAFTPMEKAFDVSYFIQDQLSDQSEIRSKEQTYMRNVVLGHKTTDYESKNVIGWLDIDKHFFMFADDDAALNFRMLCTLYDGPKVDLNLNYLPHIGQRKDDALSQMKKLANTWNQTVFCKDTGWGDAQGFSVEPGTNPMELKL